MRRAGILVAALAAACGGGQGIKSDWEEKYESQLPPPEEALVLPAYPREQQLIEFFVAATSEFRFFVDGASVSVGDDGIVRYTLVARSSAGAQNVSFEGMRCATREVRLYAVGRDGGWMQRAGAWRPIEARSVQRWHNALYREYFCPNKQPPVSRQAGIDSLRRGGPR